MTGALSSIGAYSLADAEVATTAETKVESTSTLANRVAAALDIAAFAQVEGKNKKRNKRNNRNSKR